MPIGSAASLPGILPQAPLSPFPIVRRDRRLSLVPQSSGQIAPPRRLPLEAAAEDPPRGRILVVDEDTGATLELQRVLREAGYRVVGPAASAAEAKRLAER